MNRTAELTRREQEIAEMFAWGASKKEVADQLFLSVRTVENHARSIYEKIGITKVNELSAWWFCTRFNISFNLSPLKRRLVSIFLLLLLIPTVFHNDGSTMMRTRTSRCRSSRRYEVYNGNDSLTL
ncbi:MAG: helix-turn-helix transcriptional regulator [Bacteroidales bacterium]|nr:helix-turn-helix transcriptional regulator [Bacteroidales bacterium]